MKQVFHSGLQTGDFYHSFHTHTGKTAGRKEEIERRKERAKRKNRACGGLHESISDFVNEETGLRS